MSAPVDPLKRKGRGGARAGAGRPNKHDVWDEIEIGHACEALHGEASQSAGDLRLNQLPYAKEIRSIQDENNMVSVSQRSEWLKGEGYEDKRRDLESWLHKRAKTHFDEETAEYDGEAPRTASVSTKPPKGTRLRIIAEVAARSGLPESTVDRFWKAFRRMRRDMMAE